MLRKRTRSHQKVQHMNHLMTDGISAESYFHSDDLSQKHKSNSFFSTPGLFVGFNPRSSESDSVRSPTSPLDFKIFSSFGNPFRCPKSQNEGQQKSWNCSKVGLSIVDSLAEESKQCGKVIRSSDCKNTIFERQMSVQTQNFCSHGSSHETPNSLPKNILFFPNTRAKLSNSKGRSDVMFEIGEVPLDRETCQNFRTCSLDSVGYRSHLTDFGSRKSGLGSGNLVFKNSIKPMSSESKFLEGSSKLGNYFAGKLSPSTHSASGFIDAVPADEVDLSEYYTCVRTYGSNPKVTHIFGDCILGSHIDEVTDFANYNENETATSGGSGVSDVLDSYPAIDFLKFCCSCRKELDGEDIYMYRGEKAFCSNSCRSMEIEIGEGMEQTNKNSPEISDKSNSCLEMSKSILFITT